MSSFEMNKIFAAILVAGIIAMLSGFIAKKLVHPDFPAQDAVAIDGGEIESAGTGAPAMPEPILHLIAAADIAQGEKLSRACAACHSFDQGGVQKIGPNLWNIIGADKAQIEGFAYSAALENMPGQWGYTELNKFLWKPKDYVPGTKMNYIGLRKPEDRASIIAWLRSLSSSPAPLPGDAAIAAEQAELAPPAPEAAETPAEPEDEVLLPAAGSSDL